MNQLARNWWVLALRGLVAALFGLIALFTPWATTVALVTLFGVYAVVDGAFLVLAGVRAREKHRPRWWALLLQGLAGLALGLLAIVHPIATAVALVYLFAAWAILTGALEIEAAIRLRDEIPGAGEWLLGLAGLLSVVLGVVMFARPGAGIVAWSVLIGVYALAAGALLLWVAFRLHRISRSAAA